MNEDTKIDDTKIDDANKEDAKIDDAKLDDANTSEEKWLAGCAICNEGLSDEMDKLIDKHNLTQVTAAEMLAEVIEERLGFPIYTPHALRKRYQRQKGKLAGQNVQATKPKDKSGTTAKARGNRTIPGPSSTLNIPRPRSKPEPELVPDTFQNLLCHANALAEGLQHWADGTIKPQSDPEVKAAQAIKDAAGDIISEYARLDIDVKGIYETESQHRISKKEGTHGMD